jgi:hypothetical protein
VSKEGKLTYGRYQLGETNRRRESLGGTLLYIEIWLGIRKGPWLRDRIRLNRSCRIIWAHVGFLPWLPLPSFGFGFLPSSALTTSHRRENNSDFTLAADVN